MTTSAFLFPGQGAQQVGMGRSLFDSVPAARKLFEQAADVLGYDLATLCFDGPADKLNSTEYSQPALFVVSMAAVERMKTETPDALDRCTVAAGLSLGEYSALAFAGGLDFESGLQLVAERGRAMQDAAEAVAGRMVSVLGLDQVVVEDLCSRVRQDDVFQLANLLCPGNIVVSGQAAACDRLKAVAEEVGVRVVPLAVAGAFHTPLMASARERLRSALEAVEFRRLRIPVVSNVDAMPHDDPDEIRRLLLEQLVSPVRWEDSIRKMITGHGITHFYELGAGRVLRGLLKRIDRDVACENVG